MTTHEDSQEGMTILLSVDEAARVLSCSRSTVRRLLRGGDLPAVRVSPRVVRVRRSDLEALIERSTA